MKIHFVGIGGIGVSALARYYLEKGEKISGSDLSSSEITEALKKKGIKIFIGKHKEKNLSKDVDLVIYSPAIDSNNPEILKAKKLKIKTLSYPQALGELTKKHFTIAVCGSHGKSTVAAMIGLILTKAKLDPTVILGTKLREFGDSNCQVGKSQYLVIEADEYKESFLNYWPKMIVLLNIDYDHPDYFKNFSQYILAYKKFIKNLATDGILIANRDDKVLRTHFSKEKKLFWYSLKNKKDAKKMRKILKIPGEFNVSNALAALTVARQLKIEDCVVIKTLSSFRGSWRRFDQRLVKLTETKIKIYLIHDYGHHPTQVRETIKGAKEKFPHKKIVLIYQPHQYQRTFYLQKEFVRVFRQIKIDQIIITDIYTVPGRESKEIMKKINSENLVKKINRKRVIYLPREKIIPFLKEYLSGGEVVILMGAGDIYNLNAQFELERKLS